MSMKNSIDTIENRTRDLPTCSAVPQPTAPPAAGPVCLLIISLYFVLFPYIKTICNSSIRAGFPRYLFYLQMEADVVSEIL
jgi:hypothetical protein